MRRGVWLNGTVALLSAAALLCIMAGAGIARAASPGADSLTLVLQELMPDGSDRATLTWRSANSGPQTLLISTTPNFVSGTVKASDALPSDKDTYVWSGLQPNVSYYARVDTMTASGLVSSPTLGFTLQGLAPYPPGYTGDYYIPSSAYEQLFLLQNPQPITITVPAMGN